MGDRQEIEAIIDALGLSAPDSIDRLGGLTNKSYHVCCGDEELVVRLPGEGTAELVNRQDEYIINQITSQVGVDARLRYFDPETGVKVATWVPNAQTMTPPLAHVDANILGMAETLRRLHTCGKSVPAVFDVLGKIVEYENLILAADGCFWDDYDLMRKKVFSLAASVEGGVSVLCHNDPLCENFVKDTLSNRMYLVDWEYAGMNDPMWDLADVIVEAGFSEKEQLLFEKAYFGRDPEQYELDAIAANIILLDFLWALWGKQRVCCGSDLSDYANERYVRVSRALGLITDGKIV